VPHALDGERMLVDEPRPLGSPFGAVAERRKSRLGADDVESVGLDRPSTDHDVDCVGRNECSDMFDQPPLQSSRLETGDASGVVGKRNERSKLSFLEPLHS
jgi:hypothetical protein